MIKNKPIHLIVFTLLCFSFLLSGCVNEDTPDEEGITVGDYLPPFAVIMDNGKQITSGDFIGKVGFIIFFNTNCKDCRKELPEVEKLWEEFKDNADVLIVAISREESEEEIIKYWEENNLTVPFSPQTDREIYSLFARSSIPRIYITDKTGKVIFTSDDTDLPSFATLSSKIESVL